MADLSEEDLDALALYGELFYIPALDTLAKRLYEEETIVQARRRRERSRRKLHLFKASLVQDAPLVRAGGHYAYRNPSAGKSDASSQIHYRGSSSHSHSKRIRVQDW